MGNLQIETKEEADNKEEEEVEQPVPERPGPKISEINDLGIDRFSISDKDKDSGFITRVR